jgi:hypothetical protein
MFLEGKVSGTRHVGRKLNISYKIKVTPNLKKAKGMKSNARNQIIDGETEKVSDKRGFFFFAKIEKNARVDLETTN